MSKRSFYKCKKIGYNGLFKPLYPFFIGGNSLKRNFCAALAALLLLPSCAQTAPPEQEHTLHIVASTYPMYLFTTAVTGDTEGVEVSLLVNAQTSCLHDYSLTVKDMKAIEGADILVLSGGGLEDFMDDALAAADAAVIDCAEGLDLLLSPEHEGHDGHDHDEEYDPHYWLDPDLAYETVETIAARLSALDTAHAQTYQANADHALSLLAPNGSGTAAQALCASVTGSTDLSNAGFITFHDGFHYFAHAFGLDPLKAIEEEEGATASAADIKEVVELVEAYDLPGIFVEKNGSRATAKAIVREITATGTEFSLGELDMLTSGDTSRRGIETYLELMRENIHTAAEVLQ